jgi:hypothetical protein
MPKTAPEPDLDLLTSADVAVICGVPLATIVDWRQRRIGPDYIRVGRHIRYRRSAVSRFLDANTNTRRRSAS